MYVTETETGNLIMIPLPGENLAALGGWRALSACDCRLTLTHTKGKLSHFAVTHSTLGDFDFEMFNYEPECPIAMPLYLASILQRFTPDRFRRWKKAMGKKTTETVLNFRDQESPSSSG